MQKLYAVFAISMAAFFIAIPSANAIETKNRIIDNKGHPAREGYLLVRRQNDISTASAGSIHVRAQTKVIKKFKYPSGLELVKVNPGISSASAIKIYQNDPNVLYAEPDYLVFATSVPNDKQFSEQWGLDNQGQTSGTPDSDINGVEAWEFEKGNRDIVVAVIDTGVDYSHPDLINNIWVNPGEIAGNGIDDDDNGYVDDIHGINTVNNSGDPMDDNEHGTHVSGIIGAEGNNGLGVSGVMQQASIIGCKFLDAEGGGDTSSAIACLNYLVELATREENPVNVVASNNSWAGGPFSQALYDAIEANRDAGILFMAAASNEGENNDVVGTYPANFNLSNIISVAAIDHKDALAYFSNYGRYSVHVAAPGLDILSTVPGKKYDSFSGTSMATPFVTGLAGLIKSADPSLDWIQIKNLIIAGGQATNGANKKTISGRRIRAWDVNGNGSLSCSEQKVVSRLQPKKSTVDLRLGQTLPISMLSINCDRAFRAASLKVMSSKVQIAAITLSDSGTRGDDVAGDGVFTGSYKPAKVGTYQLKFSNNDVVTLRVKR